MRELDPARLLGGALRAGDLRLDRAPLAEPGGGAVVISGGKSAYGSSAIGADVYIQAGETQDSLTRGIVYLSGTTVEVTRLSLYMMPFSGYPAPSFSTRGYVASVSDSTTKTWGATVTGGGSYPVLAFCNGTNWTVFAA